MSEKDNEKTFVFVHDIVEANGKTIKENNMEKGHTIPLGALVEVENLRISTGYEEEGQPLLTMKGWGRLYVTRHGRDCDGTPLYGLCDLPVPYPERSLSKEWTQVKAFSHFMDFGYSEESLKPTGHVKKLMSLHDYFFGDE